MVLLEDHGALFKEQCRFHYLLTEYQTPSIRRESSKAGEFFDTRAQQVGSSTKAKDSLDDEVRTLYVCASIQPNNEMTLTITLISAMKSGFMVLLQGRSQRLVKAWVSQNRALAANTNLTSQR